MELALDAECSAQRKMMLEMSKLTLAELLERARAEGLAEGTIDQCLDDISHPRTKLLRSVEEFLLERDGFHLHSSLASGGMIVSDADQTMATCTVVSNPLAAEPPTEAQLRQELAGLNVKQLKTRARGSGASNEAIEEWDEAPDIKAAAADLIVSLETA